ncbi:hypothetical protein ABW19_dt0201572 [Dactylella cylindrospora]|nr:hypothetical protein ABW19_dt0201572 [Dactylella cylindrospora]
MCYQDSKAGRRQRSINQTSNFDHSEFTIDKRKKDMDTQTERTIQGEADNTSSSSRIYIGNLLYTVQRSDLIDWLYNNGFNVVNLDISIDPMSGRNPSYCFADLESPREAIRAIKELNGQQIMGRDVKIKPATTKAPKDPPTLRIKESGRDWRYHDWSSQGPYEPTFDRWSRTDAESHFEDPVLEGKRLWVGNLPRLEPQSAVDAAMQLLFSGFKISAVSEILSPQTDGKSKSQNAYYLFVDLAEAEDVQLAINELNRKPAPWGGVVRVQRARDNRDRKFFRDEARRIEARGERFGG